MDLVICLVEEREGTIKIERERKDYKETRKTEGKREKGSKKKGGKGDAILRKERKRERRRTKICEREWKRKKRGGYFEKGD